MKYDDFSDLIGEIVEAVHTSKGSAVIGFQTKNNYYEYYCDGDCCSTSWLEHLTGLSFLIGQKILSCENIEMPSIPEKELEGLDWVQNYGYRLVTQKGYFELEMRNESNGCYGGSIIGPMHEKSVSSSVLTEDF